MDWFGVWEIPILAAANTVHVTRICSIYTLRRVLLLLPDIVNVAGIPLADTQIYEHLQLSTRTPAAVFQPSISSPMPKINNAASSRKRS
jgi:hypothetical protein